MALHIWTVRVWAEIYVAFLQCKISTLYFLGEEDTTDVMTVAFLTELRRRDRSLQTVLRSPDSLSDGVTFPGTFACSLLISGKHNDFPK